MKCDVVIYSNTLAIGLFYFKWEDGPSVMFIYEAEQYAGNNSAEWTEIKLQEIKTMGDYCVRNEKLAPKIKEKHKAGDTLDEEFYKAVSILYAKLSVNICPERKTKNYYFTRKIIYTDLMKFCQLGMALHMIYCLEDSEDADDKIQAFQCAKILAEVYNNGKGYYELAYCYQEGIGVEKNREIRYSLVKKAADLGVEEAKEWIANQDSLNEQP